MFTFDLVDESIAIARAVEYALLNQHLDGDAMAILMAAARRAMERCLLAMLERDQETVFQTLQQQGAEPGSMVNVAVLPISTHMDSDISKLN